MWCQKQEFHDFSTELLKRSCSKRVMNCLRRHMCCIERLVPDNPDIIHLFFFVAAQTDGMISVAVDTKCTDAGVKKFSQHTKVVSVHWLAALQRPEDKP